VLFLFSKLAPSFHDEFVFCDYVIIMHFFAGDVKTATLKAVFKNTHN
jgi:hypothetical protein